MEMGITYNVKKLVVSILCIISYDIHQIVNSFSLDVSDGCDDRQ